jgi:DNA topoisomerase I
MPKNLVIVESPAKAKTIEKFLGQDYLVKSSYGHIRDLDKGDGAIDIENGYLPKYIVSADKKKVVKELKELSKNADTVWLASDEDREGEAISWHLFEVLGLKKENTRRIVFNEITKTAIDKAIANPRGIDVNLVNAQQARRVLDRLVGFELSPLLWRKVKPSLSAGRVQSVAVRLVVEREREIRNFEATSDFRIVAHFDAGGKSFKAVLNKRFKTEQEAQKILEDCIKAEFKVLSTETKPLVRNPSPPFTTSTLQQEASRKLGFPVARTMQVAQKLYEEGHITYMRTDSVNLSQTAIGSAKDAIHNLFGAEYSKTRNFSTKTAGAQEAHEAIRPTYFQNQKAGYSDQEKKLYDLIWKRAIASQMASAQLEKSIIKIQLNNTELHFVAEGEIIKFDGFLKVYIESTDDEETEEVEGLLPSLSKGERVNYSEIAAEEMHARPPSRYTEASLVKKLEELGIGRPSTYAPTISTIQKREYVVKGEKEGEPRKSTVLTLKNEKITRKANTEKSGSDKGKMVPTDIGMLVTDFLLEHFDNIMDYGFTASVEKEFDEIASGSIEWAKMIDQFYKPFHKIVDNTLQTAQKVTGERELGTDPKTGLKIIAKMGKYGPFVQLGPVSEDEKPKYAKLRIGQNLETITLEEALDLFKLPRTIGAFEDLEIVTNIGRYGPYLLHNEKFVSLPKGIDPLEVSLEEAISIIEAKREEDKNSPNFPLNIGQYQEQDVEVNKGRFGPYVKFDGKFYSLPKGVSPTEINLDEAIELIEKKNKAEKEKLIKTLGPKNEMKVQKGNYGPYLTYKKKNFKIPEEINPEKMTYEEALELTNTKPSKKKAASKKK